MWWLLGENWKIRERVKAIIKQRIIGLIIENRIIIWEKNSRIVREWEKIIKLNWGVEVRERLKNNWSSWWTWVGEGILENKIKWNWR